MRASLLKSTFNGIGSGAGVAWPFFGLVFALIGCSVGSTFSLILGGIAFGLFTTVCLPIVYFSYQQMQEDEFQFQQQLQKNEHKLITDIDNYINNLRQAYLPNKDNIDVDEYFLLQLNANLNHTRTLDQHLLVQYLSTVHAEYQKQQRIPQARELIQCIARQSELTAAPSKKVLIPAFFDFVGTFGSIAGCIAGFSGMLTGIGVFSSFAAFPVLGWGGSVWHSLVASMLRLIVRMPHVLHVKNII